MRKRLRNKFSDSPISKKMFTGYICFALVFFLIAFSLLQISFSIYSQKLYEKSLQELDFFSQSVNNGLKEAERLNYNISMDTMVQQNLHKMLKLKYPSVSYNQKLYKMRNILLNEYDPQSCIRSMIYVDPYGNKQEIGTSVWTIADRNIDEAIGLAKKAKGAYATYGPKKGCQYLIVGREIRNRLDMSLKAMGTLLFICDIGEIIEENKGQLESSHASVYIYSEQGIVYRDENIKTLRFIPEYKKISGYRVVNEKGKKYFVCYLYADKTGWMYVNYFPYSDIYGQVQTTRYLLLFGFAVVSALLMLCMRKIAYVITEPLEHLTESMQIVESGDFMAAKAMLTDTKRKDEIGMLTREFQVMLDKVDVLIKENYQKQILLKDTKYKMLRAQINPHFLYNTLNVIHWMIRAGRNEEAGKMIVELGAILHYSFAQDPYATVQDEINMVKSFIAIQQIRYQGRIEFHVETYGKLDPYIIPRMILQPLVENAINYGAESGLDLCSITVCVTEEEQKIRMSVTDTGAGMTQEELQAVREMRFIPKGHGIGLKNIKERLRMDDENSVFSIDSELGKGTVVQIEIYKKTGENDDV